MTFDEPADRIIEVAGQEGIVLSRRQLAEWHRSGLIPKPKQPRLGRAKGSESIYPTGATQQAMACAVLMDRFGSKRRVGWELWALGFPVAKQHWRAPFKRARRNFRKLSLHATDATADAGIPLLSERADALIAKIARLPQAPTRLGIARRRLGQQRFEELIAIIFSASIGSFELTEDATTGPASPARLLARMLGVEAGQHKQRVPLSPILEVTGEAAAENLAAMAKALPQISGSISAATLSEATLSEARDELAFLINSYLSVRENEKRITPGSTPDIPLVRQLFGNLSPDDQASAILIWWASREVPGWRERLLELRQAVALAVEQRQRGVGGNARSWRRRYRMGGPLAVLESSAPAFEGQEKATAFT